MKTVKKIDDHIRERTRESKRIKIGKVLSVQVPPKNKLRTPTKPVPTIPLKGYEYICRFFTYKRDAREHTNNITITANTLTYAYSDTGSAGNAAYASGVWTDSTKAWTINEWINHYLKVDGFYYKIISNTTTALTIDVSNGLVPDESLAYSIVPFIPNQFIGSQLVPDTSIPERRLLINANTETIITIAVEIINDQGEITTGDSVSPYNTFIDTSMINNAPDDYWNNYSVLFTSGANADVAKPINDYVTATGTFITDDFSNAIAVGDDYSIRDDMLFAVGATTFAIQSHRTPIDADFTSAPGLGNVITKELKSVDGEIHEAHLQDYFNAIYSIELHASRTGSMPMNIDCSDSIKITLTTGSDDVRILTDSGYKPNETTQVNLDFTGGMWHRLDIYFYAENGVNGFKIASVFSDIIDSWRDVIPPTPDNFTATGGDKEVTLEWNQDERYKTQIWVSADDVTYTWLASLADGEARYSHTGLDATATWYYKIRHQNKRGDLSSFTDVESATTWEGVGSKNIVITSDNYPYVKEGDVLSIKVNLGTALNGNPTVELYDSGGDTSEDAVFSSQNGSDYNYTYTVPSGLNESAAFYFKIQATSLEGESFDVDSETFTIDYTPPTIDNTKFVVDSDGITTALDEEVVVRASNFIISRNGALADSLAGIWKMYAQPCLSSTSTGVGVNYLTDIKLIGWTVNSLNNYYLVDSANSRFTISAFNQSTGQFTVTGTPASGAYYIMKYAETSQASWQYEYDYNDDGVYAALLNASMQTNWLYNFTNDTVKYGFVITGSDKAGNIETDLADFALATINYNTSGNTPTRQQWYFWDGSNEVFPNENGWLNSTNLYLRVIIDATPSLIDKLYYRRWNGTSWESWQADSSGLGQSSYTFDINLSSYEGARMVQFYSTNKLGVQTDVITVEFKYDKSPPTWTIADGNVVGGFNRIKLGWSNQAVDTGSGVAHINIYRNTVNSFPGGTPIGNTQYSGQLAYLDSFATDTNQTYYYWGKAEDFAGNEQVTEQYIGNAESIAILPADVDGKLRITSSDEDGGTAWLDTFGISDPVEGVTIRTKTIASGSPTLNYIRYSEDGITYYDVANPQVAGVGITIAGYALTDNSRLTITFTPKRHQRYWKVKFNNVVVAIDANGNVEASSEIEDVHFATFLAADLLIGNILRLANGLSIKALGTGSSSFIMDSAGQLARNQAGTPVFEIDYVNDYLQFGIIGGNNYLKRENGILEYRGTLLLTSGEEVVGHGVNWEGDWAVGHGTYYRWDAVKYTDGNSYLCIVEHTSHVDRTPTNGTYWEMLVESGDDGADQYYIKPESGTAIHNHSGTLEIKGMIVEPSGESVLTSGTIKLYLWNGTDKGYTWSGISSADIDGTLTVYLSDGVPQSNTIYDTITLVDIADGAPVGTIEADPTLSYSRAKDGGAWTPSDLTTELTAKFYRSGVLLESYLRVVTLTSGTGNLTATGGTSGNITCVVTGNNSSAITLTYTYDDGVDDPIAVEETVISVQGGDTGSQGVPGADGADGAAGVDSRGVNLTTTVQAFPYNSDDTLDGSGSATITATAVNTSGTVYYEFFIEDVSQGTPSTTNTLAYTAQSDWNNMPEKVEVQIRENGAGNPILARDQITIHGIKKGSDAVTVIFSNEAHSIPCDKDGNPTSYSNSGNDITAFIGATQLSYDGITPYTVPSFRVSAAGTGITPGSASTVGQIRRYANASAMTSDPAKITFTITVTDLEGNEVVITREQSFSKSIKGATGAQGVPGADGADGADGTDARVVNLTTDKQVFDYESDGTLTGTSTATITASALNTVGTVYYEFFKNDVSQQNTTSNTYSYTAQNSVDNMPDKIEVQIREGSGSGTILARDQISMYGVKEGADGVTIISSNEAHTLATTNPGVVDYANSGTDIKVFLGNVPVEYKATLSGLSFKISAVGSNVTVGAASIVSTYTRRFANCSNMTANTAKITFTITVRDTHNNDVVYTRVQSLSKSIEGGDGADGNDGADGADGDDGSKHVVYDREPDVTWSNSAAWSAIVVALGRNPVVRDTVLQYNNDSGFAETRYYTGGAEPGSWTALAAMFDGDLIVHGTVGTDQLIASSVTAAKIAVGAITAAKISVTTLSAITADLGTITAGTVTGATIKTAASGDRVEMDSAGMRIYNYYGGGAAYLKFYHEAVLRMQMISTNLATYFNNVTNLPFSFNRTIKTTGDGSDLELEGSMKRIALPLATVYTANNDTNDWGKNSHVRLDGTSGINIRRIKKPTDDISHIYYVEASSSGNIYDIIHDYGNSGDYRCILTADGSSHQIGGTSGRKVAMLMYSTLRGKWILLNHY